MRSKAKETLYDRAKSNYKFACKNFEFKTDDEFRLNLVGYLLQQAIELHLKHLLELNGIRYPKTHNIEELLYVLLEEVEGGREYFLPSDLNTLELFAGTITSWESKTRYIKNFFVEERQIKKGISLIGSILKTYGKLINKKEDTDKEEVLQDIQTEFFKSE